jgi:5-methylcytosine-specific restriction endonuclease McrA
MANGTFTCEECGAKFEQQGRGPRRKYCSPRCQNSAVVKSDAYERGQAKHKQRRREDPEYRAELNRRKRNVARVCEWCGADYLGRKSRAVRFCSWECHNSAVGYRAGIQPLESAKNAAERRRIRKRMAFVENVYRKQVFERDGWKCQICGKAIPKRAKVPEPKAPTIDHIIPLAVGGTHEMKNVQAAHFWCNANKSANAANDQLLLFG